MPGPMFTNFLLADEINRTPPKTQTALLQTAQSTRSPSAAVGQQSAPVESMVAADSAFAPVDDRVDLASQPGIGLRGNTNCSELAQG